MNKIRNILVNLFLVISFFVLAGTLFLLFFPYQIVKVNKLPYPVKTKVVKASENLILDLDYCKYYAIPAVYSVQFREMSSQRITTLGQRYGSDLSTGCQKVDFAIKTPEDLAEGDYTIRLIVKYKINPLREVTYTFMSEEFHVNSTKSQSEKLDVIIGILDSWELNK